MKLAFVAMAVPHSCLYICVMLKPVAFILIIILAACQSQEGKAPELKPYKFNRDALDKLVKENKAMYEVKKREDGTLRSEAYYLGDTVKYELQYDKSSRLQTVYRRNEHGLYVWQENYYPDGQRKAHYNLGSVKGHPEIALYDGRYEEYYENGKLKETGEYKRQQLMWQVRFDQDGHSGDTLEFDYGNPADLQNDTAKSQAAEK